MKKRKIYIAEHENGTYRNSEADQFILHTERLFSKNQKMVEITLPEGKAVSEIMITLKDADTGFELSFPMKNINRLRYDDDDQITITWSVEDFEDRAAEIEKENEVEIPMYDRTKFRKALRHMFEHHDCNTGITWGDVDYCLDAFCRLPLPETEPMQP